MFVQSIQFVKSHRGNTKDISIYGQEYTGVTYKLAKMNLAIRGISANLGDVPADTFFKDQHPDLKADYIMANPPFNQSQWREKNELEDDPRWSGFTTPPTGNANYAWILHMLSKLSENGTAGFVLANGSMSTNTSGEGEIRQQLIEKDMVDCMIALPGQLFYTTQIPVCLWFVTKNKTQRPHPENPDLKFRDRKGETLFIDARKMGTMIDRTQKELTKEDIEQIANTYHSWRNVIASDEGTVIANREDTVIASDEGARQSQSLDVIANPDEGGVKQSFDGTDDRAALAMTESYQDIPGYCKSASLSEIQANDYVLTPGRYVGVADEEDDGIHFEDKMTELTVTLKSQLEKAKTLDQAILENLKVLGYE